MGASLLLSLGARAMNASQAAINTIGHNIANANTPGYSRQTVVLKTATPQFTGGGFQGKGVQVDTINRSYNQFLTREANGSRATAAADQSLLTNLQRLEKVLPPGESGLGQGIGQFLNAMVDVASRPSDPSARQVVLSRAKEMASRFASAGAQLQDLQQGVVSELKANVVVVNQIAQQIAVLNGDIARLSGSDSAPNDLLDQRDQMVAELSKYIGVTTIPASDGSVGVFIGGGQVLVLGVQAQSLAVEGDPYDAQRAQVSLQQAGGTRVLDESSLSGGAIAGLVSFQNNDLQDARNYVGQLATAITMRVNEQQALGLDLGTPPSAGVDMLAVGGARVLPASTNARDAAGNYLSGVVLTRVDPGFLQASSYVLKGDPAAVGSYLLVRESDGLVRSVANGDVVDGFRIDFSPAAPGPFDTYRLEPVANAAVSMRRVLDQTQGVAAASPISAITNVANTGTASVDTIYAVDSTNFNVANFPADIVFGAVNADGSVNYTLTTQTGIFNSVWRAGQPIGNETGVAQGFALNLIGVPRPGDSLLLNPTAFPAQNNGNVKAFLALQSEAFVGQRDLGAGVIAAGATLNDAYAAAMGDIGARVQGTEFLAKASQQVAEDAESARSGEAGVNLDEEAARLLQFQQAYQASAKMLQVAQVVFDELLQSVR
jgi:flagellar hook-associated protein 1 FlgK